MKNTTIRSLAAVACSVALATSFAGCGSDSKDDDKGESKTLSVADFKEQANKLCKEAGEDTAKFGEDISESSSDADVSDAIDKTVDRNKKLVEDIDDLEAPDSIEDDVDSMLDSVEDGLKQMGEVSSLQDLMAFDPTGGSFKDANDKATALGLPDCAG
ncbi:hypothetical protein ABIE44_001771 [Marmoricola sp. OAE513]|uniref:hypothetical protein n=1 Tax=Marmoricola sp. OAE513 TaxID=2817894 RepID=UPI001AE644F9